MRVVPALDAGAMLKKTEIPITEHDTAQTLHDALAKAGGELMAETLEQLETLPEVPQDESLVTYAAKLQKSEALLDWGQEANALARKVRAFNPFPVAYANMQGEPWRIWSATEVAGHGEPGQILAAGPEGIDVACASGALRLLNLQRPGGKPLGCRDFLAGRSLRTGDRFDA